MGTDRVPFKGPYISSVSLAERCIHAHDGGMNHVKYLELAAQVSRLKDDDRTYFHGAVGVRKDGVIVCSANGNPKEPEPRHHAEARVLRKMGKNAGIIYVVRTLSDGTWGMSKPCPDCAKLIKHKNIHTVVYSFGFQDSYVVCTPVGLKYSFE